MNSKMSLFLVVCLALTSQVFASELNSIVNLNAENQKVILPVIVDGQQYYVGFAYNYKGEGGSIKSMALAFDTEMNKIEAGHADFAKVANAGKALFAVISAKFEAKAAEAPVNNEPVDEPVNLLDTETNPVNNDDIVNTDNGTGTTDEVLPSGQPIKHGSRVVALAHTVTRNSDGTITVSVKMPAVSTGRELQSQRMVVRSIMSQLAINPSAYISTTNGTTYSQGTVRTVSQNNTQDAEGNITYTATYQVSQ